MASSVLSSATAATVSGTPVQASMVAPFTGLKSNSTFPVTKKNKDVTSLVSNGCKIRCMQVYMIINTILTKLTGENVGILMRSVIFYIKVTMWVIISLISETSMNLYQILSLNLA